MIKITVGQLRRIISEEIRRSLTEGPIRAGNNELKIVDKVPLIDNVEDSLKNVFETVKQKLKEKLDKPDNHLIYDHTAQRLHLEKMRERGSSLTCDDIFNLYFDWNKFHSTVDPYVQHVQDGQSDKIPEKYREEFLFFWSNRNPWTTKVWRSFGHRL